MATATARTRTATAKAKAKATKAKKPKAKPIAAAKPVTARALLRSIVSLQEQRGLDEMVLIGALLEVIATHQPTARQAVDRIAAMLDAEGIR